MQCTHHFEFHDDDGEKITYNCVLCGKKTYEYRKEEEQKQEVEA